MSKPNEKPPRGHRLALYLAATVALWLTACVATPGGSGHASKGKGRPSRRGIEEYFVGEGEMQYFLLPQRLEGPAGRYADLDLVVRDSAAQLRHCLLHLSVVGPERLAAADTVLLTTSGRPVALAGARVLFAEPRGQATLTRLELPLAGAQVAAYLRSPDHAVLLSQAGRGRTAYRPGKKAAAQLRAFAAVAAAGN